MPRKPSTERRLIELNTVPAVAESLRPYLADSSCHVVAKAAGKAADERVEELLADLVTAFEDWTAQPARRDPGCTAKLALLDALDALLHDDPAPFRTGARWVQLEPGPVPTDSAPPLRIRGAAGLVRLRTSDAVTVLAEHLADNPQVQSAAIRALIAYGDPFGAALVRLRLAVGVDDGEVLTDCLGALLALDPADSLELVAGRLRGRDQQAARAAALALAEVRPEGAFALLCEFHAAALGDDRAVARTALAMLRSDEADAFLAATDPANRDA